MRARCEDSLKLAQKGARIQEIQKIFWLLCLACAPARGDEKPWKFDRKRLQ